MSGPKAPQTPAQPCGEESEIIPSTLDSDAAWAYAGKQSQSRGVFCTSDLYSAFMAGVHQGLNYSPNREKAPLSSSVRERLMKVIQDYEHTNDCSGKYTFDAGPNGETEFEHTNGFCARCELWSIYEELAVNNIAERENEKAAEPLKNQCFRMCSSENVDCECYQTKEGHYEVSDKVYADLAEYALEDMELRHKYELEAQASLASEHIAQLEAERNGFYEDLQHWIEKSEKAEKRIQELEADWQAENQALNVLRSAHRELIKERDELKAKVTELEAKLWIAKDSQLRTYDGLTEKADKYDELKAALQSSDDQLTWQIRETEKRSQAFQEASTKLTALRAKAEGLRDAMNKIKDKRGFCIYGSSDTDSDPEVAFRQGSHYAFGDCANIASQALAAFESDEIAKGDL